MTSTAKPIVRPLSPHLQVYRLPLAAILSITHRITGVGLALGLVVLTWWVTSAAYGPGAYALATTVIGSWIGLLILFGFSVALFFHLSNGIRHLVWDTGRSYEIADTRRGNILVILGTVVLTAVTWFLAFM